MLAYAQLLEGQTEQALNSANRALTVRPLFRPTVEVLACCAAALGHLDEARRQLRAMKDLVGPESHFIAPMRRHNPGWDAQIAQLLRAAEGARSGE